jgi:hypothetical protein
MDENGVAIKVEVDCSKTASTIASTLKIDIQNSKVKVYPLLISITDQDSGVVLNPKTWIYNFNSKNWKYKAPENYQFVGKDF